MVRHVCAQPETVRHACDDAMLDEPLRNIEYKLIRIVDSQQHVATFTRYQDDSGLIRHGGLLIKFEFDWPILLDHWLAMRDAGWQTLDDAIEEGVLSVGTDPTCDCPTFDRKALDYLDSGMPIPEVNRRMKEEGGLILAQHDRILWGE